MKTLIKLTFDLAYTAVINAGYAQTRVDIAKCSLFNPAKTSMGLTLGKTESEYRQVFGQPDSTRGFYSELDEDTITIYKYGRNEFSFLRGELTGYDLIEPSILVGTIGGAIFRIKETIAPDRPANESTKQTRVSALADFPISLRSGVYRGTCYHSSSIVYLKDGNAPSAYRCSLLFGEQNKLIRITLAD